MLSSFLSQLVPFVIADDLCGAVLALSHALAMQPAEIGTVWWQWAGEGLPEVHQLMWHHGPRDDLWHLLISWHPGEAAKRIPSGREQRHFWELAGGE